MKYASQSDLESKDVTKLRTSPYKHGSLNSLTPIPPDIPRACQDFKPNSTSKTDNDNYWDVNNRGVPKDQSQSSPDLNITEFTPLVNYDNVNIFSIEGFQFLNEDQVTSDNTIISDGDLSKVRKFLGSKFFDSSNEDKDDTARLIKSFNQDREDDINELHYIETSPSHKVQLWLEKHLGTSPQDVISKPELQELYIEDFDSEEVLDNYANKSELGEIMEVENNYLDALNIVEIQSTELEQKRSTEKIIFEDFKSERCIPMIKSEIINGIQENIISRDRIIEEELSQVSIKYTIIDTFEGFFIPKMIIIEYPVSQS